jgi:hypothetical protein
MRASFGVHDDALHARIREHCGEVGGLLHHEMRFNRQTRTAAQCRYGLRSKREVRDETPVHHVDVQARDKTRVFELRDLIGKPAEVRIQE